MTLADQLDALRQLVQHDPADRGLAHDPADNLFTACRADFAAACRDLAATPQPVLAVVTGFPILAADPVCAETDGPPGALFLARALVPAGVRVLLAADPLVLPALAAGLRACRLDAAVPLVTLPESAASAADYASQCWSGLPTPTHLAAVERVGPGHTSASLLAHPAATPDDLALFEAEVPPAEQGLCRNMRGRDVTPLVRPADLLFDTPPPRPVTLGLGDGGNEIGMGKLPWSTIRRNIPDGGRIACRVPTDYLLVAGVSNWAAQALAVGTLLARGTRPDLSLLDRQRERDMLQLMVEEGPLVDGVTARRTPTVDGLSFADYVRPLTGMARLLGA